jgi:signal peptidase II
MGTNFGSGTFYLITSFLILLVVIYFIITHRYNKMVTFPLAAIAGGAIGNIIDRLRIGRVIDFMDFDFFDINFLGQKLERWWTFNIADAAISAGMIILIFYILFHPKTKGTQISISADSPNGD